MKKQQNKKKKRKEKRHKSKNGRFKVDTDNISNSTRPEAYKKEGAKRGNIYTYINVV